jgi:hypothetical protein
VPPGLGPTQRHFHYRARSKHPRSDDGEAVSQATRILAVLQDGKPHSTAELYRRVGGMILHSRVAELRKRGYRISCEYVGGSGASAYVYTLTEPARSTQASSPPDDSLEESGAASTPIEACSGQLSLQVAA